VTLEVVPFSRVNFECNEITVYKEELTLKKNYREFLQFNV
jgi:hypothetical protein